MEVMGAVGADTPPTRLCRTLVTEVMDTPRQHMHQLLMDALVIRHLMLVADILADILPTVESDLLHVQAETE